MSREEENWPAITEAFHQRGVRAARSGYPRLSKAQWILDGQNPDTHRFYLMGYDDTFEAMTPEQRKRAALKAR